MSHSFLGYRPILYLVSWLAVLPAAAQTVKEVLPIPAPFLNFTVTDVRDLAVRDNGDWFAVAATFPPQGTSLSVIYHVLGVDGVFTPGLVPRLSGASSTLVNDVVVGDFAHSGTTIFVSNVWHGLLPGEAVRLHFFAVTPGNTPPADGVFSVQSVLDDLNFTVTHGSSGTCGSALAPCGKVELVRTIQAADLNASGPCLAAFQGVLQLEDDADPGTPPVVTPTQQDSGLFWNSRLLLREGQASLAPQVSSGTTYTRIWRSVVDSRQDYLLLAKMNDPLVAGQEDALVRVDVTDTCPPSLVSEQVLVRTGSPLQNSSQRRFRSFHSLEKRSFALNDAGDFLYLAALTENSGFPSAESALVLNNRVVLLDFTQVPGGTGQIVQFPVAAVDLNDLGDYAVQVRVQESAHGFQCPPPAPIGVYCFPFGEAILTGHRNGGILRKLIQSRDPLPDPSLGPPGEILLKVGTKLELTDPLRGFPVLLTNGGDVLWYGEWGHLDALGQEVVVGKGIFFNHKVIAQVGQVLSGPSDVLLSIGVSATQLRSAMEVSPNGRHLLFTGLRGDPRTGSSSVALFRVDLGESVPYGTVVQASGGPGCTYAYPRARLDCTPGLSLPGSSALGDFPLLGHWLQALATSAPAGTVTALFAFKPTPTGNFPCGSGSPFEFLLGPGPAEIAVVGYGGSALLGVLIPRHELSLLGSTWYCQAFFHSSPTPAGSTLLGATNALRFVIGAR